MAQISSLEAIENHLYKDQPLPLKYEGLYNQVKKCWSMFQSGKTSKQITRTLGKEYGLSYRQSKYAMDTAISLYGDMHKAEKEGLKWVLYNKAEQAYHLAKMLEQPSAMVKAVESMSKLAGLDKQDGIAVDYEKLKDGGRKNIILLSPEQSQMLSKITKKKGKIDLSAMLNKAEEAEIVEDDNAE